MRQRRPERAAALTPRLAAYLLARRASLALRGATANSRGPRALRVTNPTVSNGERASWRFVLWETASSSSASRKKRRPRAGSSSPTPPRKSRRKAKSSPSAPARATTAGKIQPLDVKAGDRILFGKWSGTEVKLDGEDLLIMKESDILGVLEAVKAAKAA